MKLFRFGPVGAERPGAFDSDGQRRDISSLIDDLAGVSLAPRALASLSKVDLTGLPRIDDDARLGPCVGRVGNFIAVGLNYADHAAESGQAVPDEPILFNKAPSCIVGPNDDLEIPRGSEKTDWEVELAVVIGARGTYLNEREAQQIVAGYCLCNDVSERTFQLERGTQWMKGKGCPTFGPLGPWLVTADALPDPHNLSMWLDVNGERMQTGSTGTMIFKVPYLVSYISQFMTLEPGDVITTGTPPGVGLGMKPPRYLRHGDIVELGIEHLGEQRQHVVEWRRS